MRLRLVGDASDGLLHPSLNPLSMDQAICWARVEEVRSSILMLEGIAMDRRTFNTALMSAAATSVVGSGSMAAAGRTVWYQGVGARLTQWDVDVEAAALTLSIRPRAGTASALTRGSTAAFSR